MFLSSEYNRPVRDQVCGNLLEQGLGIEEILQAVVNRVPPPKDTQDKPLRALIFDSAYDVYKVCSLCSRIVSSSRDVNKMCSCCCQLLNMAVPITSQFGGLPAR
jgi:translation elongation factor EF-4